MRGSAKLPSSNLHVVELGEQLGSSAAQHLARRRHEHPGQASFRLRFDRVADCLRIHDALPRDSCSSTGAQAVQARVLLDRRLRLGLVAAACTSCRPQARCLVDLGHHLPNTNVEQIVSRLAMTGRLGGFHFNDSKYGDDDLTVGSIRPFEIFLVMLELLEHGGGTMPPIAYMIDQSNNLKDPIEDLLQATTPSNTRSRSRPASTIRRSQRRRRTTTRRSPPEILQPRTAPTSDPLSRARRRNGAALDPLTAYRRSGYRKAAIGVRGSGHVATGCRHARRGGRHGRDVGPRRSSRPRRRDAGDRSRPPVAARPRHASGRLSSVALGNPRERPPRARPLQTGPIASISIDGWAVDYGLLDEQGRLLSDPHSYRSPRTERWRDVAHGLGEAALYRRTGVQLMPINTIFQLAVHDRTELDRAARLLMLPELVAYELTGAAVGERSNAGTTGLLDVATGTWASDLAEAVGVSPAILQQSRQRDGCSASIEVCPSISSPPMTPCAVAASPWDQR